MKNTYRDLIEQTFYFPQEGFEVIDNQLHFNGIDLMEIIKQYGTPLKISYLPKIASQIKKAKRIFNVAIAKADYKGTYTYCYCTKSSHFSFVLNEVLRHDVHIETSSAPHAGRRQDSSDSRGKEPFPAGWRASKSRSA